jgi:hypothetical protein
MRIDAPCPSARTYAAPSLPGPAQHRSNLADMSLDTIADLGIVLAFVVTAFTVSVVIGVSLVRFGMVDADDVVEAPGAEANEIVDGRPMARPIPRDETA